MAGFDPVSFAVGDRSAARGWAEHLDGLGVRHSDVAEGTLGWTLDIADPDGTTIGLYSTDRGEVDNADLRGHARTTAGERSQQ